MQALAVHNLTKYYSNHLAINQLSFSIEAGCVVGFLGPNGAGKTTTLRILCGLIPASSGTAQVCGISVASNPLAVKKKIGYMPENNPLPDDLRVGEYLRYRAGLKDIPHRNLKAEIDRVMELSDLRPTSASHIIGQLSKGYRQRLGVADALLGQPPVIILDEPTVGLDPRQVLRLRHLLENLRGQVTLLISSHILAEVEASCDHILILNAGQLVAAGTPQALKESFIEEHIYEAVVEGPQNEISSALSRLEPRELILYPEKKENVCSAHLYFNGGHTRLTAQRLLSQLGPQSILLSFFEKKPTLEDVFLEATRRNARLSEATLTPFGKH